MEFLVMLLALTLWLLLKTRKEVERNKMATEAQFKQIGDKLEAALTTIGTIATQQAEQIELLKQEVQAALAGAGLRAATEDQIANRFAALADNAATIAALVNPAPAPAPTPEPTPEPAPEPGTSPE